VIQDPQTAAASAAVPVDPEPEIALDVLKRAVWIVPVVAIVGALGWGAAGAASAIFGLAIAVANLVLSAYLLAWSARISHGLLMATALFGYLIRLALIFGAVWLVKDQSWVELWPLGLSLILCHLGLLFWELRFVSASLAYPGLQPRAGASSQGVSAS
jgi:hypothetical protein